HRHHGLVSFTSPSRAVETVERLSRFGSARRRYEAHTNRPAPQRQADSLKPMAEAEALRWLHSFGVPVVAQEKAASAAEAVAAAERLGYPVVLKIDSPQILHKTEVGGVAL